MKKPTFFRLYLDNFASLQLLSEKQVGKLIMAIYAYAVEDAEPDFSDDLALQMTFSFMRRNLDSEFESYRTMCERNQRVAAMRRGSSPNTTSRNESLQEEEEEKEKEEEKEEEHSLSARVITEVLGDVAPFSATARHPTPTVCGKMAAAKKAGTPKRRRTRSRASENENPLQQGKTAPSSETKKPRCLSTAGAWCAHIDRQDSS